MPAHKRLLYLLTALILLLAAGCGELTVNNNTPDRTAHVFLKLPDRSSLVVTFIPPGQSQTRIVQGNGTYTVLLLTDDEHQDFIDEQARLSDSVRSMLNAGSLTGDQQKALSGATKQFERYINEAAGDAPLCRGKADDNTYGVVDISWQTGSDTWSVECTDQKYETQNPGQ